MVGDGQMFHRHFCGGAPQSMCDPPWCRASSLISRSVSPSCRWSRAPLEVSSWSGGCPLGRLFPVVLNLIHKWWPGKFRVCTLYLLDCPHQDLSSPLVPLTCQLKIFQNCQKNTRRRSIFPHWASCFRFRWQFLGVGAGGLQGFVFILKQIITEI